MSWENANHIMPYLFLGNMAAAYDQNFIIDNNIKLVINCTRDITVPDWYGKNGVHSVRIPLNDNDSQVDNEILQLNVNKIIELIHQYRLNKQNVFVHCFAGMQRSATIISVYLMRYYQYRPDHTIFYIRHKRRIAFNPKPTFGKFIDNYPKNN